jgi:biopolymer transport protein ExbB
MKNVKTVFAALVIVLALGIAILIYVFVLGNSANFIEGNSAGEPIKEGIGSYLGVIYKGGFLVPVLIAMFLIVITFTVERMLTIQAAKGRGSVDAFITRIRSLVTNHDFAAAEAECDRQKGSVANVVKAGLHMYKQMEQDQELDKERKILAIQKELEEATTLELPMLSKNLVVISTIASIATLMGLLGTVFGMIRAFRALAQAGAPDAIALSTGISEALINTALGILTSAIAIIFYNYFTNKIDALTYGIDEAGYTIVQNFAAKNK